MTGRHRAPTRHSHTGPIAVGLALGAATGPLLVADGPAEAAPSVNWDAVAACESTNDWSINTGNGFSGGLQFTDSTWKAFGGSTAHAYQASRAEQIAVAERTLAGQGIGAWPVCGPKGLGGTTAAATTAAVPAARPTARSAPVAAPQHAPVRAAPTRPAPAAAPAAHDTGRDPVTGLGSYVCDPAHLYFRACDPPQLGQVEQYPYFDQYSGPRHAAAPTVHSAAPAAQRTAAPAAASSAVPSRVATVLSGARSFLGTPYLYGGESHAGIDCSGLVQAVYSVAGVHLPRTADAQMHASTIIPPSAARAGDLVFSTQGGVAFHVGVVIDPGHMIDSSVPGHPVAVHAFYPGPTVFGRVL
jgi:cell wall-associated NlpC family hydrolase